jgi:DNA polymerase-3 subunit alpha
MHLADVNALSRPGADDKTYVLNKDSGLLPEFVHPIMAEHLSWTYGVVVYEEQILMILRDLGGFAPAELNRMRKIIHDKLGGTAFNENRKRFIEGAAAHGLSEIQSTAIWDGMVSASGYAFNIAHSVSYAHIGYWQQWLKIHYPAEFYAQKLSRCPTNEQGLVRRGKFIMEARRHKIEVLPPDILYSQRDWSLVRAGNIPTIIAGFEAIEGIGPKTAQNIIDWRGQIYTEGLDWEDLKEVKGIGEKTIRKIVDFVENEDPFGVDKVKNSLDKVRDLMRTGRLSEIPTPTHTSIDIPKDRELVCYMGIPRWRKYYDAVESYQKKNTDADRDEALANIEDNHLLKYAAVDLEDEYGETVKIWFWRKSYPRFEEDIHDIKMNKDVVVVKGYSSDFSGVSIGANELYVVKGA